MRASKSSANSSGLAAIGANRLVRYLGEWASERGALHVKLAAHVNDLVATGAIPSGTRLPSERSLAAALHVSRNTVAKAFDDLRSQGVIVSRQGDGSYVSSDRAPSWPRSDERLSTFVSLEQSGRSARIDLRSAALPGLPMVAGEIGAIDGTRMRELVASHGYLPSGLPEFRHAVANYYEDLGLPTSTDHILVTSGAQQALRLVASMYVSAGSTVLIEEPSFRGAIESLKALSANLVGVPSGADGIDVDALRAATMRLRPSLIVLQSTVHNPSGSVMNAFKRSKVVSIAAHYSVPIIDDVTLADTIIDGDRRPVPLASPDSTVITVGSLSKSFWGGLRVGWIRAHPDIIEQMTRVKGGEDLGTSLIAQLIGSQLLSQIDVARDARHSVLLEARRAVTVHLRDAIPDWEFAIPAGGASLWVKLPSGSATTFAQKAERDGVLVLPGPTFSCADGLDDHLRISFAGPTDLVLRGIDLLAGTWRSFA